MSILTIFAALVIGFAAGLRALTAPAVVTWSAYLGFLDLRSTPFGFVASPVSVVIFSVLAIGEYVGDLLPNAPNRTARGGLIARILTGSFSAACLLSAISLSWGMGFIGAIGAVAGTFGGFYLRTRLTKRLSLKDFYLAIPEDLLAIGLAFAAIQMIR